MNTEEALLSAARNGETTVMRALADFYRERDNQSVIGTYSDKDIATSFYVQTKTLSLVDSVKV